MNTIYIGKKKFYRQPWRDSGVIIYYSERIINERGWSSWYYDKIIKIPKDIENNEEQIKEYIQLSLNF